MRVGLLLVCVASCGGPSSVPWNASAPAQGSATAPAPSAASSATPARTACAFSVKDAAVDCEKAWTGYGAWIAAGCAEGNPDTREAFFAACTKDMKPGVRASYGCLERYASCETYRRCEDACFADANGLGDGE